ncbi:MAG: hypothetical protein M3Q14_01590 [bacterium]|nr:hypothetical protein [bacterium]
MLNSQFQHTSVHEHFPAPMPNYDAPHGVLAQKLERIEASLPMEPSEVDFDFRINPEQMAEKFGRVFHYFGRVEGEVALNVRQISSLLHYVDPTTKRFLDIWQAQELPHGQIFDQAQEQIGVEPAAINAEDVSAKFVLGGELSRIPKMRDVLLLIYLGRGAMHERMTAEGYRLLKNQLTESGETGFVHTAIEPILKQEAGHLGYYKLAANIQKSRMSPRQLRAARLVNRLTYGPVGAANQAQQREFDSVTQDLTGENLTLFAKPIQEVSKNIFEDQDDAEFVVTALSKYRAGRQLPAQIAA